MAAIRIVTLEGDQTGQELLEQALRVLDGDLLGLELELERFDLSLENRRATNNGVCEQAAKAIRDCGLGLKAPTITPEGADDVGSPNRIIREAIDGKVIVRTGRRIPGVTPVAGVHHPISVCRMAVGDAYGAKQWREDVDGDEAAYRTDAIRRSVCRAVAEYSFREAERLSGRVYGGPKWTVSPVYEGMLKEEIDAAAERHPEIAYEPVLIDATLAGLVSGAAVEPLVIPCLNRDGDLLSDLVLPLFGSIAGAESVLLGLDEDDRTSVCMAEAPHGTAPVLEGKDIANPMGMILAAAAVLHYADEVAASADEVSDVAGRVAELASRAIYEAVLEAVAAGVRTPDLGGSAGTTQFTDEVIGRVRNKFEAWSSLGTGS
ncbi:MAG TPA: isocitrate/isopropylmalate family dehydrogenase [Solirubrobacterales bacterium]|jgi:isocitrate dehydrogenase (NAD+)|nr:isocitrate/isopropylmalate family dehydrogenase [Solirubrobacterales bacterium]